MTLEEFSNGFDTLLNSYATQANFGEGTSKGEVALDEYEKSVFLSKAQEEIVLGLYNGSLRGDAFESSEEIRRYLANLVAEDTEEPISNSSGTSIGTSSKFFSLKEDLWFITYESVSIVKNKCGNASTMEVIPVTQDEYHRVKNNPFRGPNDRRALRLDLSDGVVEIVCKYTIDKYYYRYIKRPTPIVLIALPDGLSIDGVSEATDCGLASSLHRQILDRAVILALQSRGNLRKSE